jgi:hypothetical protein
MSDRSGREGMFCCQRSLRHICTVSEGLLSRLVVKALDKDILLD